MKVTMRWKLMGSHLLLALLLGGVFFGYLNHTLEKNLTAEIRNNLYSETQLARLMVTREITAIQQDAPAIAAVIGLAIKARVTIIASDGRLLGDSEVPPAELAAQENHAGRPEIAAAVAQGRGDAIRYSATLRTDMLYVALPFQTRSGDTGIIRLALPLSALDQARSNLHTILGISLAMAVLLSLILSYILSNVTTRSLRIMAAAAGRIGKGETGTRIPVTTRDEIGDLAGVINDMAVRIEGQLERTSEEKNRLDTILRGMGEGLMVADVEGIITMVNPAFRTLFAIQEDVEGKPLINISRHPALHEAFRIVTDSKSERLEELHLQASGEQTVLIHWVPLLEQEELLGVVAVFHDISDIRRLEKIRSDFVANVSHELRTPVTVIRGYAEALQGGSSPEQAERFITIILNHAERLATLIDDLLTLSRLEGGNLSLEFRPVTLEEIAATAAQLLEQKGNARQIMIDRTALAGIPAVLADPGRLEQVLVNLLDNAIKYSAEGSTITISATSDGDMVKVAIKDHGIGIPSRDLPRIFERFYRVDAARSRDEGGTGLGLAIVKHIVQLHGGNVSVDSEAGKGSTFYFTLKKG
jgi:two-component system phosphate regulon sensor histidine kinase PhoR